jgi:hypothetical protein
MLWSWGFHCVGLLGVCFFALPPFSGVRSVICQPAPCCQCVTMVCWLFFNFAVSFDFGCCSLTQEMSFVGHYLPYFRQWLIIQMLSAFLPFQPLFTESLCRNQLLVHHPFSGAPLATPSLFCVLVFSSLFIVQGFFLSAQKAMLVYSRGGWGSTAWCLLLTCLVCQMSPKQVWSWHLAVVRALLFSQCNMAWRSILQARDSGCWSFNSPCSFISTKCGSSVSVSPSSYCLILYPSHHLGSYPLFTS